MNILPIVLDNGHMPVVTFFGPVLIIFWVLRRPISKKSFRLSIKPYYWIIIMIAFKNKLPRKFQIQDLVSFTEITRGDPDTESLKNYLFKFGRAGIPSSV